MRATTKDLTIKRVDHTGSHAELRAIVSVDNQEEADRLMLSLREKLPDLEVSYMDAKNLI